MTAWVGAGRVHTQVGQTDFFSLVDTVANSANFPC